jgi:hypothetical protein
MRENYVGTRDWWDERGFEVRSSRFSELRTPNFELRIAPVALGVPVARLRGRRNLAENLPLRIEPIIERRSTPVPSLTVELIGPLCDQDVQVIAGRQRQCVRFLR